MNTLKLSPLYQALVYLEDMGEVTPEDFSKWGKSVSRGVIGKMDAMGLIENNSKNYKLSEKGYKLINGMLDAIHEGTVHWDGIWRFVFYSIPEKERSKRDKFRRLLESLGMRPILNCVWVSPYDIKSQIYKFAKKENIIENILITENSQFLGISQVKIISSWNFDKYRNQYLDFIHEVDEYLNSSEKNRYLTKVLIFKYALLLNSEPNLPIELMPKDWPKFRAQLSYRKLRRQI